MDTRFFMPIDGAERFLANEDTLRSLENIPTLLMFCMEPANPYASLVRYGILRNIHLQDNAIFFYFVVDPKNAYIHRLYVNGFFSRNIGMYLPNLPAWNVIEKDFPPSLLDKAVQAQQEPVFYREAKSGQLTLKSLRLVNFLSYGPNAEPIELKPLNVLIGPNGAGKSNLLEALALLQAAPEQVSRPVEAVGETRNWLYRGQVPRHKAEPARVEASISYSTGELRYALAFDEVGGRFKLTDELLEENSKLPTFDEGIYYQWNDGNPIININWEIHKLKPESLKPAVSILAQKRDTEMYREITDIAEWFGRIKIYREWEFGPYSQFRSRVRTESPSNVLLSDGSNLALVVNNLRRDYDTYQRLLESFKLIYPGIKDIGASVEGGQAQIFIQEENNGAIPASRLSDGTLRYLFLLIILHDPNPPPLICLDEPEMGLHPDMLPTIADLLREASERTQLIVTTHSPILVDAFTETPECILVCEQTEEGSILSRLDAEELKPWLQNYRLGQLWMRGDLGGTRW